MADGCMVYTGPPSRCMQYLARVGYAPPMDYNPADFIMDLVTSTEPGLGLEQVCSGCFQAAQASADVSDLPQLTTTAVAENTGTERDSPEGSVADTAGALPVDLEEAALLPVEQKKSIRTLLIEAWDNAAVEKEIDAVCATFTDTVATTSAAEDANDDINNVKYLASYRTQFIILLERALLNSKAQLVTNLNVFQAIAVALICGALWWDMPNKETRVADKSAFIFFFMTYWVFSTLFHVSWRSFRGIIL